MCDAHVEVKPHGESQTFTDHARVVRTPHAHARYKRGAVYSERDVHAVATMIRIPIVAVVHAYVLAQADVLIAVHKFTNALIWSLLKHGLTLRATITKSS